MQNETNHSMMNSQLMSVATSSRSMKPSSEDKNEGEELEMSSLKRVRDEPISNYSSIQIDTFPDRVGEQLSSR